MAGLEPPVECVAETWELAQLRSLLPTESVTLLCETTPLVVAHLVVLEHVQPDPMVEHAVPVPVENYAAPTPVVDFIAPAPSMTSSL